MPTTYSDTQMQHAIRPGEIVIEIDNEHVNVATRAEASDMNDLMNPDKLKLVKTVTTHGNRNQHFPPVDMRTSFGREMNCIRTRRVFKRDPNDTRRGMHDSLWNIEYIPGERIHIDFEAKIGRITDSIFDPENDELYNELRRIGVEIHGGKPFIPGEAVDKDLSDPFALWGWAYHMARIMQGDIEHHGGTDPWFGCSVSGPRLCRPVQGIERMPTLEQIISSCKVFVPHTPYQKPETNKEWEDRLKSEDPNYTRPDPDKRILTPYLAGFGPSKQQLETAGK